MSQHRPQPPTDPSAGGLAASPAERDHLCVDAFIGDAIGARALATAFDLGVIDFLIARQTCAADDLHGAWQADYRGLNLLLDLLAAGGVIECRPGAITLTPAFVNALRFRDLLEAKLQFTNWVAPDLIDLFTDLIRDPAKFHEKARMFRLFRYDAAGRLTPDNLEQAKRWMRITTALTRYESAACINRHDFAYCRRVLDIGGNSGELALQICRRFPDVQATVFDLPIVCEVGRSHIQGQPGADRISFVAGDARVDALPRGFDLVVFKSMLHDWPDNDARLLLTRAADALNPGGTLLIFERGPLEPAGHALTYSMLPLLLLFRSFRSPAVYVDALKGLGFADPAVERVELETAFFLVKASRPTPPERPELPRHHGRPVAERR